MQTTDPRRNAIFAYRETRQCYATSRQCITPFYKKGKGKKSIKSFFSCCVFFFLHCWWRIRCLGKSLPISFYQAVRHTYSLLFQVSVHQFVYFQPNDDFFSPSPWQATCGTVCQPPLFSYDMQGVPGFKLSQGLVFDSESRSVQALTTANG